MEAAGLVLEPGAIVHVDSDGKHGPEAMPWYEDPTKLIFEARLVSSRSCVRLFGCKECNELYCNSYSFMTLHVPHPTTIYQWDASHSSH